MAVVKHPRDKDYSQTHDGLYFCVYAYLHEPERITAYLQYLPGGPDPRRDRVKPMDFPHVGAVVSTMDWLAANYPQYVAVCPIRQVRLPLVPVSRIARYYRPEERLAAILAAPHDPLEQLAGDFARAVAEAADIPLGALGITGSVLLDIHDPETSDLDLVVYGRETAERVHRAFAGGVVPDVAPMPPHRTERWLRLISTVHPHTREEAAYFIRRRWNYGFHRGREFGIKAVRRHDEITERLPDRPYRHGGLVRLQATIADAGESCFLPAIYRLTDLHWLDGEPMPIATAAAFEGLYAGAFDAGQRIEITGRWEETGDGRCQVVVGSEAFRGREYMRLLSESQGEGRPWNCGSGAGPGTSARKPTSWASST
jgi:uncharacterized protein